MTKCKSCKTDTKLIYKFGKLPLANSLSNTRSKYKKYDLSLVFCKKCLLVQTKHNLKKELVFHKEYPYLSSTSKTSIDFYKKFSRQLDRKFNLKNKFIIEVGSNDGYLLQFFKQQKNKLLGIEPSNFPAKIANKKGIPTLNKFFNYKLSKYIISKYNKADFVIANNVFAHIDNLNSFVKGFENLLTDKGILIIEFQYLCNLVKDELFDNIYHEHYFYYSLHSIIEVLKKYKLYVFDCEKISTHGGSLRVYVKKEKFKNKITLRVNKILNEEEKIGINKFEYYKNISKKIKLKIKRNIDFFENLKIQNKKIAGFGAAAKTSSVLNFSKINFKTVNILFDKSKPKQNKFLSGTNIRIIKPTKKKINEYDILVIFIWNLKNEILRYLKSININKKIKIYILHPFIKKIKIK